MKGKSKPSPGETNIEGLPTVTSPFASPSAKRPRKNDKPIPPKGAVRSKPKTQSGKRLTSAKQRGGSLALRAGRFGARLRFLKPRHPKPATPAKRRGASLALRAGRFGARLSRPLRPRYLKPATRSKLPALKSPSTATFAPMGPLPFIIFVPMVLVFVGALAFGLSSNSEPDLENESGFQPARPGLREESIGDFRDPPTKPAEPQCSANCGLLQQRLETAQTIEFDAAVALLSPDASTLALTDEENIVRVVDVESGSELARLRGKPLEFDEDNLYLAVRDGDAVTIFSRSDFTKLSTISREGLRPASATFVEGSFAMVVGSDSGLLVFDPSTGLESPEILTGFPVTTIDAPRFDAIAVSGPAGGGVVTMASCPDDGPCSDDVFEDTPLLRDHSRIEVSDDGQIFLASSSNTVTVWGRERVRPVARISVDRVAPLAFLFNDSMALLGTPQGLTFADITPSSEGSSAEVSRFGPVEPGNNEPVRELETTADGTLFVYYADRVLVVNAI